ncbi:hypothetical protein SteCoe_11297 [Stentor coeruleus]|uniref:Uncharacterized protein n=1 Tax=Stentor coeruleus TaxID=5963 RepID=A0A1R2CDL3_9CILI|nr:hypothetical protein SteCoe_11297 [Stentor coeruleus]
MEIIGKRQFSLRKAFIRPDTARATLSSRLSKNNDIQVPTKKFMPKSRKLTRHEVSTSPMIFDCDNLDILTPKKLIVIIKPNQENEETSSTMVREEIIREHKRKSLPRSRKIKCPLAFLDLPLSCISITKEISSPLKFTKRFKKNNTRPRLLKRHYSDHSYLGKNNQKTFDLADVLNISSGKIKMN